MRLDPRPNRAQQNRTLSVSHALSPPCSQAALVWCLATQEAMLYAPWPLAALRLPCCREERDPGTGELVFRGARWESVRACVSVEGGGEP